MTDDQHEQTGGHHLPTPKETVEDFWRAYLRLLKASQTPPQKDDDE